MAKQKEPEPQKVVVHPSNCDQCDGSGWVRDTYIKYGRYTEGVRRCPNWKVETREQ